MPDDLLSQHPADRLIREIIATRRSVLPNEIEQIVDRIATAPFDPQPNVRVLTEHRGLTYLGQTLGSRASSLTYHLVKRVVVEEQWTYGTSPEEYIADLREASCASDARIVVFERRGGRMAAIIAENRILPRRLGTEPLSWVLVVFSADRGTIVSGYQVSSNPPSNIPEDGLWLR